MNDTHTSDFGQKGNEKWTSSQSYFQDVCWTLGEYVCTCHYRATLHAAIFLIILISTLISVETTSLSIAHSISADFVALSIRPPQLGI